MRITLLALVSFSQFLFASGWLCTGEEDRWDVSLYNHVDPKLGTTNPAQFSVSEDGEKLVVRFSPQIDFLSTSKGTTYRTTDSENIYGCVVNFHIGFREGVNSVPAGTKRAGKLFFTQCTDSEEESTHKLTCTRYLKNP